MLYRIVDVQVRPDYRVWIRFEDGTEGEVDLSDLAGKGVFERWSDPAEFKKVYVDEDAGTIAWPGGLDLAPDRLYRDLKPSRRRGRVEEDERRVSQRVYEEGRRSPRGPANLLLPVAAAQSVATIRRFVDPVLDAICPIQIVGGCQQVPTFCIYTHDFRTRRSGSRRDRRARDRAPARSRGTRDSA